MTWYMGIDIGSVTSKGVILGENGLAARRLFPSGMNYAAAAERLRTELTAEAGISTKDIRTTVATGCGAAVVPFADDRVIDVRCCARGVHAILPAVHTIVDVGGQSTQVMKLNDNGQVVEFLTNEKCAAGSASFYDIVANVLQVKLNDIGPLSLKSKNPVVFSTGCAVFVESEAITRVAEGCSIEDILAGVNESMSTKIAGMVERIRLAEPCALIGGGARNIGLVNGLKKRLGIELLVPPQPQIIMALGAALAAAPDDFLHDIVWPEAKTGETSDASWGASPHR